MEQAPRLESGLPEGSKPSINIGKQQQEAKKKNKNQKWKNKSKTPQKDEALEAIQNYKAKLNAGYKDIKVSEFFTEWFEDERKNLNGDLSNDFENEIIKRYVTMLEGTEIFNKVTLENKQKRVTSSVSAGFTFALALRLLKTASKSQKTNQIELNKLIDHMEGFEVPSFYNVALSNVGKFSDPVYGNFRIQSPLLRSQQRMLKAMLHLSDYQTDFICEENYTEGEEFLIGDLMTKIREKGWHKCIFNDHDSVKFLKYVSKNVFDYYLDCKFRFNIGTQENPKLWNFTFPKYDLKGITREKALEYLKEIDSMDSEDVTDVNGNVTMKNVRDYIAACIIFSIMDKRLMSDKISVSQWDNRFANIASVKDAKVSQIIDYVGYYYIGDKLRFEHMVHNCKIIHDYYNDYGLPYLKPQVKMSHLDASEFGNTAQLIEPELDTGTISNPVFRALTKFGDTNLNVMGGIFNYVSRLDFKRNVKSVLNISKSNFYRSNVATDFKYSKI